MVAENETTRGNGFFVFICLIAFAIDMFILKQYIWGKYSVSAYHDLQKKAEDVTRQIEQVEAENKALSHEVRLLKTSSAAMERAIREKLNFVKENEILYIFDSKLDKGGSIQ